MDWTPDGLVTLMGIVLSLAFAYFPILKSWFEKLTPEWKPLFMAILLLLVAAGKLLVECQLGTACLLVNWQRVLWVWFLALVANQTAFSIGVKQVKRIPPQSYNYDFLQKRVRG